MDRYRQTKADWYYQDYMIEHAPEEENAALGLSASRRRKEMDQRALDRARGEYDAEDVAERKGLGIRSPLATFKKSIRELIGAGDLVGSKDLALRVRELRGEAVGEMLRGISSVQAAPAMTAGSPEAYSAIVARQLASPMVQLSREANAKLDQIVANTRAAVAHNPAPGALGFN